jgi:hypothetical protein
MRRSGLAIASWTEWTPALVNRTLPWGYPRARRAVRGSHHRHASARRFDREIGEFLEQIYLCQRSSARGPAMACPCRIAPFWCRPQAAAEGHRRTAGALPRDDRHDRTIHDIPGSSEIRNQDSLLEVRDCRFRNVEGSAVKTAAADAGGRSGRFVRGASRLVRSAAACAGSQLGPKAVGSNISIHARGHRLSCCREWPHNRRPDHGIG